VKTQMPLFEGRCKIYRTRDISFSIYRGISSAKVKKKAKQTMVFLFFLTFLLSKDRGLNIMFRLTGI